MSINNKQLELYKKYFELFTNDENEEYTERSSDSVEDELDDGLVASTEDSSNVELNSRLKSDVEELKRLIRRELDTGKLYKERLEYSLITREFYSKNADYDGFGFIEKLQTRYLDETEESNIIFKMLRHTELALVQKASLSDRINDLERQLAAEVTRSQQLTKNLEDTNKSWNEKINDLDKQLKSLVTEIIGIMGVFATIIFAVFSGFNEISTLGGELSNTPISKVMIYIGTTFIVLIGIVFISYLAVGRFFDISLRSCGCKLDDECSHELIEKHPTVIAFIWIGLSFISIGAILILYKNYIDVFQFYFWGCNLQILVLLICLIAVPVIGLLVILKKPINRIVSKFKQKEDSQ